MAQMYHHLLITPSHAVLVCKRVSDQTCSKGVFVYCLNYRHFKLKRVLGQIIFDSLRYSIVSRSHSSLVWIWNPALIPASELFLCTVVTIVRGVYFSFLRHRHLPSIQKIANAMLSRLAIFSLHIWRGPSKIVSIDWLIFLLDLMIQKKIPHATKYN